MQTSSKTQSTLMPNPNQTVLPETVPSETQIHIPETMTPPAPSPGEATAFWTIIAIAILAKSTIISTAALVKVILKK